MTFWSGFEVDISEGFLSIGPGKILETNMGSALFGSVAGVKIDKQESTFSHVREIPPKNPLKPTICLVSPSGVMGPLRDMDFPIMFWDDLGNVMPIPNNKWVVMPLYITDLGNVFMGLGQHVYACKQHALDGIIDHPRRTSTIETESILRGWLVIKEGASFSEAVFLKIEWNGAQSLISEFCPQELGKLFLKNSAKICQEMDKLQELDVFEPAALEVIASFLPSHLKDYFLKRVVLQSQENFVGQKYYELVYG